MTDLADGETTQMQGSGATPYTLKNSGGVYSCSCPAWRNQSIAIERRTCKHLRKLRGDEAEKLRTGSAELSTPVKAPKRAQEGNTTEGSEAEGTEPPLLLAHRWENHIDLTGYWLSEKLDGVRAYWDGKQFWSRLGNKFYAPPWFTTGLPSVPLDGELWGGRKLFQRTVGIVKRQDESPLWRDLLFVIFDAPAHGGLFEARIAHCEALFAAQPHPYVRVHQHEPCKGVDHLKDELVRVETLGGEGLMARQPASSYEAGRSYTLLKVKTFHDAEARVIDYAPGAGRHKGRVGALIVELEDGTRFNVGTGLSDQEREQPPAKGSLITFRYQELSDGGVPRFPSYVGVRIDGKWKGNPLPPAAPSARSDTESSPAPDNPSAKPTAVAKAKRPASTTAVDANDTPAPTTAAPASPPSDTSADTDKRYFEFVDGKSGKFWEIKLSGTSFTTRYGKLGTAGQMTLKQYDSPLAARKDYDKLIAEKTKKGYVER